MCLFIFFPLICASLVILYFVDWEDKEFVVLSVTPFCLEIRFGHMKRKVLLFDILLLMKSAMNATLSSLACVLLIILVWVRSKAIRPTSGNYNRGFSPFHALFNSSLSPITVVLLVVAAALHVLRELLQ